VTSPFISAANGKVFLSYRREDTRHQAARLYDRLADRFGGDNVFLDVDSVPPGTDFSIAIDESLAKCSILLALIGPRWLTIRDEGGVRRLDDPNDLVVLEIGGALSKSIRVIPILVDGADPPIPEDLPDALKPLATRNAMRIDHETFRSDVAALTIKIEEILPPRNSQLAGELASRARMSFDRGQIAMARQLAMQGIQADAENAACYLIQAMASHALDFQDEADLAIRLAVELSDDMEIRAAAARMVAEGKRPDLPRAYSYNPSDPKIRARYLQELSRQADWATAFAVAPELHHIGSEYSLSLIRKLMDDVSADEDQLEVLVRAFELAPFLNGKVDSHSHSWSNVGTAMGQMFFSEPIPNGRAAPMSSGSVGRYTHEKRGAAAFGKFTPEANEVYEAKYHERQFIAIFKDWFDRVRSKANGACLEKCFDRILIIERLPRHVHDALERMKDTAYSAMPYGSSIAAFFAVLFLSLIAAAISIVSVLYDRPVSSTVVWLLCLSVGVVAVVGALRVARCFSPAVIGRRRRSTLRKRDS
jgi:hypothetical protein